MFSSVGFLMMSSDNEFYKAQEEAQQKLMHRRMRQRLNPLDLPDERFIKVFRLSKDAFRYVFDEVKKNVAATNRSTAVPNVLKLAITLQLLSQGGHQKTLGGENFNLGLAQPTISKIIGEVIDALESTICPKWITFDMDEKEKREAKLHFYRKTQTESFFGFPGIIGCVDGHHFPIATPRKEEQHNYFNCKGFHSINAMIVCDHEMRIRYLDATHEGSTEDDYTWTLSELSTKLKNDFNNGERNTWLIGDADYPLEPVLITPYKNPTEGSPECQFNTIHAKAWITVERTIKLLKRRFRCLHKLLYTPPKAVKIINVCAALHNICIQYGLEMTEDPPAITDNTKVYLNEEVETPNENTAAKNAEQNEIAISIRNDIMKSILKLYEDDDGENENDDDVNYAIGSGIASASVARGCT